MGLPELDKLPDLCKFRQMCYTILNTMLIFLFPIYILGLRNLEPIITAPKNSNKPHNVPITASLRGI